MLNLEMLKRCGATDGAVPCLDCGATDGAVPCNGPGRLTVTLLNTSIVTAHGEYVYSPISLEAIRQWLATGYGDLMSAIGHQSTAEILSELLSVEVSVNRIEYRQGVGDVAIVFKLRGRAPEGVILSRTQVEEIGYEFGVLQRTK